MEYAAFVNRLNARLDELKWLYCELYRNDVRAFEYFVDMLRRSYDDRKQALRDRDERRLADPDWYRSNKMLGMMLYVDNFAGDLKGVRAKLPYLKECGVNYLHLMPLLRTVKGRSDGGYAVADFRAVQPELGTMEDLERLADDCREAGISGPAIPWRGRGTSSTTTAGSPTSLKRPSPRSSPPRPRATSPGWTTAGSG